MIIFIERQSEYEELKNSNIIDYDSFLYQKYYDIIYEESIIGYISLYATYSKSNFRYLKLYTKENTLIKDIIDSISKILLKDKINQLIVVTNDIHFKELLIKNNFIHNKDYIYNDINYLYKDIEKVI